jgi:Fe2+ transport system protein FeoA
MDSISDVMALGKLAPGESGTVLRVGCARPIARRLLEMGLLPGTRVEVVRVAPFGDPIELTLRGYALSIRRAEAMLIEVSR